MGYRIEKNQPLPPRPSNSPFPWAEMKAGDSILVDWVEHGYKNESTARSCVYGTARTAGIKVMMRKVDDRNFRVWRTS